MTIPSNVRSRIAAVSVIITLLVSPVVAQTPVADPAKFTPTGPVFLDEIAFGRLAHVPLQNANPPGVAPDSPRPNLLRQATAAAGKTQGTSVKAPQKRNWVSRHKVLTGILIGAGTVFVVCALGGCGLDG